ncbi:MAG: aminoglycoside phosphotransferase family protein [Clostridiaceae bacterium]|nr:aminoglycoside phosphotransferase family protein [Clostridiaceae bacterium]
MEPLFEDIMKQFNVEGDFIKAELINSGHINDTYFVSFRKKDNKVQKYTLQRINHYVFKEPDRLMNNIIKVTNHIREKVKNENGNPKRETLTFIPALNGKYFYKTPQGDYWRVYSYIENAVTYQKVEDSKHFYSAGKAFGKFQMYLNDFSAKDLHETIPDFHNTPKRLKALIESIDTDSVNRAIAVKPEIDFVMKRAEQADLIVNLLNEGSIPLRVTHNDTKFNNVLIDINTGDGICVIDLDTVMPGSSLYDYGDSIRSGANTADEDEPDLSKVWLDIGLFENFTRGYFEMMHNLLKPKEIEYLPFSSILITLELGMRFLMDYINGDTYFKVHREGHNLDRARVQFKLVADMEKKYDKMKNIVDKYK